MTQRDPGVYLEDIEYNASAAVRFISGYSLDQYLADEKTRAAVERVLEICGEAMNNLHKIAPAIADGIPIETRCMSVCVGKIRLQSLVALEADGAWKNDPTNPVYYLVHEEKVALPLYPQFGTSPNGFYIPPRWVPRPYLEQMFGPGVETAIERYVYPSRRLLAVLALFRATRDILFRFEVKEGPKVGESEVTLPSGERKTLEIFNDTVIGYNAKNRPAVTITIEEPVHVRPEAHYNST